MRSQWLRRTKAIGPRRKLGHFILPETAAMPIMAAEHLFERENFFFGYQHPVSAGLHRRRFVGFSVAVVNDGLADDAKVNGIWLRCFALFRPRPKRRCSDGADDLRGLPRVVKTFSVLVYVGRRLHWRMWAWVSIRTLRAWVAAQFKSDFLV